MSSLTAVPKVLRLGLACLALSLMAGRLSAVEMHNPAAFAEQRASQIADAVIAAPLAGLSAHRGGDVDKRVPVPFLALVVLAAAAAVLVCLGSERAGPADVTRLWPRVGPGLRAPPLGAVAV